MRVRRSRTGTGINRGRDNGILNGGRIDTDCEMSCAAGTNRDQASRPKAASRDEGLAEEKCCTYIRIL